MDSRSVFRLQTRADCLVKTVVSFIRRNELCLVRISNLKFMEIRAKSLSDLEIMIRYVFFCVFVMNY